jgi:hypothetical protein
MLALSLSTRGAPNSKYRPGYENSKSKLRRFLCSFGRKKKKKKVLIATN